MKTLFLGSVLFAISFSMLGCDQVEKFADHKSQTNHQTSQGSASKGGIAIRLPASITGAAKYRAHGLAPDHQALPGAIPPIRDDQAQSSRISLNCSELTFKDSEDGEDEPSEGEPLKLQSLEAQAEPGHGCEAPDTKPIRAIAWLEVTLTERIGRKISKESVSLAYDCSGQAQLMLDELDTFAQYQISAVMRSAYDPSVVYQGSTKSFSGSDPLSQIKLLMQRQKGDGIDIIFDEDTNEYFEPGHATIECVVVEGEKIRECHGQFIQIPSDGPEIAIVQPINCLIASGQNSCRIEFKGLGQISILNACEGGFEMKLHSGEASFSAVKICSAKPQPMPMPMPPELNPAPRPTVR